MKRNGLSAAGLLAALALLAIAPHPGRAQAVASAYQAFSDILNPDPNSGLTTFRSLLVPMGGLAEGMGTAYTAVARDSSYFESNPAASSCLDYTELAVFHNNWIADSKIEGAVYTIRYKGLGFGVGGKWLYLPFTAYDDFGERSGSGYYSEAMAGFNLSYNLFPGYYFNGIAVGATGKLAYRSIPAVEDESITETNNALRPWSTWGCSPASTSSSSTTPGPRTPPWASPSRTSAPPSSAIPCPPRPPSAWPTPPSGPSSYPST